MDPAIHSPLLAARMRALRQRHVRVTCLTGAGVFLLVAIELLALSLFADWWLSLPWAARVASLALQGAVATGLLYTQVLHPARHPPDEDALALLVERERPQYRSRLISSLQLTRAPALSPGVSTELIAALVAETDRLAAADDFRDIISTARLKLIGSIALLVLALAAGTFAANWPVGTVLLSRLFLSRQPVPRKTVVLLPSGDLRVGIGDSVRLEAWTRGQIPREGQLEIQYPNRLAQRLPVEQDRLEPARFGRTIESVLESFSYQFSLGDGTSERVRVLAVPRPAVARLECELHPPPYAVLPVTKPHPGEFSFLAGSTLRLRADSTHELAAASLRLIGTETRAALIIAGDGRRSVSGEFRVPARGLNGFQIQLRGLDGMESRESAIYRVDVLPDRAPVVRLTFPERKEELVTRVATLTVGFEATDDFRILRARLRYKLDQTSEGETKTIDLAVDPDTRTRLRRRYDWKLREALPSLAEGNLIEYWVEVEDNNDVTGPGIGSTDHQLAKVVSEAEKRADLLNRASDYLGSLGEVTSDQERLNRSLGSLIRERAGGR